MIILETGLKPDDASGIKQSFQEFVAQTEEWAKKALSIVVLDEDDEQGMENAAQADKALRALQKEVETVHKDLKADSLAYGRALDEVKRNFNSVIEPARAHCKEQAAYRETMEKKRQEGLKAERIAEMKDLNINLDHYDLGVMPEDLYQATLAGLRHQKAEAEKQAAAEKKAAEKAEADRKAAEEAQRKENERLKAEAKAAHEKHEVEMAAQRAKAKEDQDKKDAELKAAQQATKEANARIKAKERQEALLKSGFVFANNKFSSGDTVIEPKDLLTMTDAEFKTKSAVKGNQDKALLIAYTVNIKFVPKLKDAKVHSEVQALIDEVISKIENIANGIL